MANTLVLTLDERQIGGRLGQPEGPVRHRPTWQVGGVPKEWQELQLAAVLEKAGMLAPEIFEKVPQESIDKLGGERARTTSRSWPRSTSSS